MIVSRAHSEIRAAHHGNGIKRRTLNQSELKNQPRLKATARPVLPEYAK